MAWGFQGTPPYLAPLPDAQARALLDTAAPVANVDLAEKRRLVEEALAAWPAVEPHLRQLVQDRVAAL